MKRMLFNATQEEELRVALVDGQRLYDLNIELPASERKKANIYKGKITRIEPSLEAAFVNYGADRHGFLPLKEISSEYFVKEVTGGNKPNIRDVLKEGQDIVVQIDKEERGTKGAALTTFVSLAGRFIVLKPNKPRSGGVSRRIVGEDRDLARTTLREVDVPEGMSVILRTAGIDRSREELEWDLNNLLAIWEAIKTVVVQRTSPFLIYRESDSVVRALRDYLTTEIGEILIDDDKAYEQAREFIEQVMPHNLKKLKLYTDPVPLFTRYQIESQIESAFAHQVTLPSGGSMVIDHTEALVSIDINSARATKGGDIEATALQTNLEAADEIGRQLRLRDLGGLVVIDFIDMGPQKHQREVESRLREAVRQDRARVQIGKISRFGLLEMSRQRLRPSLGESSYLTCPRCSGVGTIRSVESLALAILRLIGEEARKERTAKVIAQLPVEVATYLLNEKRDWVQNVEARHKMQVILVANPNLETPHYVVRRVRDDQLELPENTGVSYELTETEEEQLIPQAVQPKAPAEVPAVSSQVVTTPPPTPAKPAKSDDGEAPGLLARIIGLFSPASEDEEPASGDRRKPARGRARSNRQDRQKEAGQKSGGRRPTRSSKKKKKRSAQSDADEPRGEQRAKGSKKKKKKKSKKKSSKTGQQEQAAKAETGQPAQDKPQSEPPQGRRRSRGGRRRRRSKDDADVRQETAARDDRRGNDESSQADRDKPTRDNDSARRADGDKTAGGDDVAKRADRDGPARSSDDAPRQASSRSAEQAGKAAADARPAPATEAKAASVDRPAMPQQRSGDGNAPKPQSPPPAASDRGKEDAGSREADSVAVRSAELERRPAASNGGNGGSTADRPATGTKSDSADATKTRLLPWEPQQPAKPASDETGDSSDS